MKLSIRSMILVSLFASLTAVGAFIRIPVPYVPFTLQLFFTLLSGIILGSRLGMLSQAVYVITGLIGIPVFADGGGLSYILKPSFGYLLGFILASFIAGKVKEKYNQTVLSVFTGILTIYLIGVPYLYMILNLVTHKRISFTAALAIGIVPYAAKDVLEGVAICIIAKSLKPVLIRISFSKI